MKTLLMEIILELKVTMNQVTTKKLCFGYFCRFATRALTMSKVIFKNFKSDFQEALQSCNGSYNAFDNYFTSCLDKHAPKRKKALRGNEKLHMNKNLKRAIIKRSKLKNKADKTKNPFDIMNYKIQRNYVTKLNKTAKLEYFDNQVRIISLFGRNANLILLISTAKRILKLS